MKIIAKAVAAVILLTIALGCIGHGNSLSDTCKIPATVTKSAEGDNGG